jgi:glycosyltransferase involved in cell wall biosynthesis
VNDGSKDDSWQKATALMEKYPKRRIRILNKRNGGLADARNVGLRHAKGTWQGLTLVHVRAQLEHLQDTFMS